VFTANSHFDIFFVCYVLMHLIVYFSFVMELSSCKIANESC